MPVLQADTLAAQQARRNLDANAEALRLTQPELAAGVADATFDLEWVFARDRSLTALEPDGAWRGGCSLPARAAKEMLAKLDVKGAAACFLTPSYAVQLRCALEMLRPEQAIIAVVLDCRDLAFLLHCENFESELRTHRLWFAAGADWETSLARLFQQQPGLATPGSFIRLPDADTAIVDAIIPRAQAVFARTNASRSAALQAAQLPMSARRNSVDHLLIVAPSRFRLWNDLGHALLQAFDEPHGLKTTFFDADDPLNASPNALWAAAGHCGAILTANTARTDLPGLLPESIPWLTWVTGARIPSPALAGPEDSLIVVDAHLKDAAVRAGWHASRVHIAGWPLLAAGPVPDSGPISVIADTRSLDVPADLAEYSSHALVWEAIAHDLRTDPLKLQNVSTYVDEMMRRASVSDQAFPRARFVEQVVIPAYQQGLVAFLLRLHAPLRIHGAGWENLDPFKQHAAGPVKTRQQFTQIVSQARALVHLWPTRLAHPCQASGRPLIRASSLKADLQAALAARLAVPPAHAPPLSAGLIKRLLNSPQM